MVNGTVHETAVDPETVVFNPVLHVYNPVGASVLPGRLLLSPGPSSPISKLGRTENLARQWASLHWVDDPCMKGN